MAKDPYEWMYEKQSQPLLDYILDEVAGRLAAAVEQFPPKIEEWDRDDLRARFEPLLLAGVAPAKPVVRVALKLYRWELARDIDAIDVYMRNERWREDGIDPAGNEMALFLWHYWTELTHIFKDYVGSKIRWEQLGGLADRLEARLGVAG